ncbi:L-histidine N(alpha)-methyltransferase [Marivirga harenae]|uniref:L-histidine N(alpha)-methyltransferase n=1 Tax=Marivirga harenae TaxID=2010992 RepID=UPI0026DEAAEA|nr:L-histidine N(alpha)-methyltransferase [Marivirga harenae]WKV12484.1 L-histidine N(alpha)-methyltransferase [Marivirga harenae]
MTTTEKINFSVGDAVKEGLTQKEKSLPSWLFYDAEGDRLFQEIMNMPEYYLTNCEYDIFQKYKDEILSIISTDADGFNLIEFGAGDGLKTEILLKHFVAEKANFNYKPVDISQNVLNLLQERMQKSIPDLDIKPINKEYFSALDALNAERKNPMVVLFMGGNIGNFELPAAQSFVNHISSKLRKGDRIIMGFDMKKDPEMIRNAYNDKQGITRLFNMNLLKRLNSELDANFNLEEFKHYPSYDPQTGTTKSFLISQKEQEVNLKFINTTVHFKAWELIHVEVSQKFDEDMIETLATRAGLKVEKYFYDEKKYFADVIMRK